jgi:prephenate dehydrogenase
MLLGNNTNGHYRDNILKLQDLQAIAVVGPGLLGGSIALGLKAAGLEARILGFGHRQSSIQKAIQIGAIDQGHLDLEPAREAQLVILATPIGRFQPVLTELAPILQPGTVITDIGSTKRYVCRLAQQLLPKSLHFVGSHPMAGSEKRGVDFARADLCQNATCIVTPTPSTSKPALHLVESLWQTLGMRLVTLSPAQHDKILARISHLPHLIAAALVNVSSREELKIIGPGFLDTTRIASGDINLWHDIIASNPDAINGAIEALKRQLDQIEQAVRSGDAEKIKQFLAAAKKKRDWLVEYRIKTHRLGS